MDEIKLLSIFPEEIWKLVFEEVKDHESLESISNASPFFRKVLLSDRVLFLFPKVWKILNLKYHRQESLPKYNQEEDYDDDEDSDDDELEEVRMINEIPHKICKQCSRWTVMWWRAATFHFRLVCQTWSSAIERIFRFPTEVYKASTDPLNQAICVDYFQKIHFNTCTGEIANKLLQHFDATHSATSSRSPFVTKSVTFDIITFYGNRFEARQKVIPGNIIRFFETFGQHFWNIKCDFVDYFGLRQILKLVPNVRCVQVCYSDQNLFTELSCTDKAHFYSEIKSNPLPTFRNLQYLEVVALPKPMFDQFVIQNDEIKMLKIREINNVYDLEQIRSRCLEQLKVHIKTEYEFCHLESFENKWYLKKLSLSFETFEYRDLSRLFTYLESNFADTLTTLNLYLFSTFFERSKHVSNVEEELTLRLRLPMVTDLTLVLDYPIKLDFILPLKESLEHFELRFVTCRRITEHIKNMQIAADSKSQITLWSCYENLLESNIWTMLSKLKLLEFDGNFYEVGEDGTCWRCEGVRATRRDWEKYEKDKING